MEPVSALVLFLVLVISSATDLITRRIPNSLTGTAAAVAVLLACLGLSAGPIEVVVVAAMLSLPLGALAILRPDGFGMGDVKLVGVMALFMGWEVWLPLTFGLAGATFFGAAAALFERSSPRSVSLPLAPFLALAAAPLLVAAAS